MTNNPTLTSEELALAEATSAAEMLDTCLEMVQIEADRPVLVLARSTDNLAQLIEWVTGCKVDDLEAESTPKAAPIIPGITEQQRQAQQRLDRLQELAATEPPAHACHPRREILAAQKEVGLT